MCLVIFVKVQHDISSRSGGTRNWFRRVFLFRIKTAKSMDNNYPVDDLFNAPPTQYGVEHVEHKRNNVENVGA